MEQHLPRVAAVYLRKIWQAHDEKNEMEGWSSAQKLYEILGATPAQASTAGHLTIQAFFLADRAESYQQMDMPDMEDFFYDIAKQFLVKARGICEMETESPTYTVQWWKAYRHKEKDSVMQAMLEEHKAQLTGLPLTERLGYSLACVNKLIPAGAAHDKKDWKTVDDKLEEYFKEYFGALNLQL